MAHSWSSKDAHDGNGSARRRRKFGTTTKPRLLGISREIRGGSRKRGFEILVDLEGRDDLSIGPGLRDEVCDFLGMEKTVEGLNCLDDLGI